MKKKKPTKAAIMLSTAIAIAAEAHCNVFDRQGEPYILHPIAVMQNVALYTQDKEVLAIAILHDVLEDCKEWTLEMLKERGLSNRILEGLRLLDHSDDSPYDIYIDRLCNNYDTILVKMSDISHNSDLKRIKDPDLDERDIERIVKYHRSFIKLNEAKEEFEKKIRNRINMEHEVKLIAQKSNFEQVKKLVRKKPII